MHSYKNESLLSKINLFLIALVIVLVQTTEVRFYYAFIVIIAIYSLLFIQKINSYLFGSIFLLSAIFIIGFCAIFYSDFETDFFVKDIIYFSRPILLIIIGYGLTSSVKNTRNLLLVIIFIGIFFALIHIFQLVFIAKSFNYSYLRETFGKGNLIEILSLTLLFVRNKESLLYINHKHRITAIILLSISIFFYFSRTDLIILLLLSFALLGFFRIRMQFIAYFLIGFASILLLFSVLSQIHLKRNDKGFEGFLYKVKIAPKEIFNPHIDRKNHKQLWDQWRAYEAQCAIEQTTEKGLPTEIFGNGFGSLVNLHFIVDLGGYITSKANTTHNGYAFVFFKTGYLGLFLYAIFLLFIYIISVYYAKNVSSNQKSVHNYITGLIISIGFITLVITGIYNKGEYLSLFLGILFKISSHKNFQ